MLPCLVNSVNRKPYTKVTSNDKKELALVPSKTQNIPVQIMLSANPIEKPLTIDFFEKEYVQGRMIQILEDIWEDGMEKITFEHSKDLLIIKKKYINKMNTIFSYPLCQWTQRKQTSHLSTTRIL